MTTTERDTTTRKRPCRHHLRPVAVLTCLLVTALPLVMAQALPATPAEPQDLQTPAGAAYGRVRHLDGEIHLLRHAEVIESEVRINTPLAPGDVIETGIHSHLEIQLADGTLLRLDGSTRVTLLALAGSLGEYENRTLISVDGGSLSLDVADLDPDQEVLRVDTDAATLFALSPGLFRIDVGTGGGTRARSRAGVLEVLAQDESTLLRSGEALFVAPGHGAESPRLARTRGGDDFDSYVARRQLVYLEEARGLGAAERRYREDLPRPIQNYYSELDHYGEWQQDPVYGTLWVPEVPRGWRPYRDGYWLDRPIGWTWVSAEPWGYAPYHYGRWEYLSGRGWSWLPGIVYAPAWVSWAYTDAAIGWTALGWYDFPSGWSLHLGFGSFHQPYWSFVAFHDFPHQHAERWIIHERIVIHDVVYARRPPAIRAGDFHARRERSILRRERRNAATVPADHGRQQPHERTRQRSFRERETRLAGTPSRRVRVAARRQTGSRGGRTVRDRALQRPPETARRAGSEGRAGLRRKNPTRQRRRTPAPATRTPEISRRGQPRVGSAPPRSAPRASTPHQAAAPRQRSSRRHATDAPGRHQAQDKARTGPPRRVPDSAPKRLLSGARTRRTPLPPGGRTRGSSAARGRRHPVPARPAPEASPRPRRSARTDSTRAQPSRRRVPSSGPSRTAPSKKSTAPPPARGQAPHRNPASGRHIKGDRVPGRHLSGSRQAPVSRPAPSPGPPRSVRKKSVPPPPARGQASRRGPSSSRSESRGRSRERGPRASRRR